MDTVTLVKLRRYMPLPSALDPFNDDDCIPNDCLPHAPEALLVAYPEYELDRYQMQEGVFVAMFLLTGRERLAIIERIWNKKTYKRIGIEMGITLERARQICNKAFRKLRRATRLTYDRSTIKVD